MAHGQVSSEDDGDGNAGHWSPDQCNNRPRCIDEGAYQFIRPVDRLPRLGGARRERLGDAEIEACAEGPTLVVKDQDLDTGVGGCSADGGSHRVHLLARQRVELARPVKRECPYCIVLADSHPHPSSMIWSL